MRRKYYTTGKYKKSKYMNIKYLMLKEDFYTGNSLFVDVMHDFDTKKPRWRMCYRLSVIESHNEQLLLMKEFIKKMIIPTKTQAGFIDEVTLLIQSGYTWLNGDTQIFSSLWEVYDEDTAIITNDELKVFGYVDNTNAEQAEIILSSITIANGI